MPDVFEHKLLVRVHISKFYLLFFHPWYILAFISPGGLVAIEKSRV